MKKTLTLLAISVFVLVGCSQNSPIQVNTPDSNSGADEAVPNSEVTVPGLTFRVNAPGPNPQEGTPNKLGKVAGILMGIWHGFIAVITLAISFFNADVQMYEVHNDGNMYNLGFLLGLILFVVVLSLSARRRKTKS